MKSFEELENIPADVNLADSFEIVYDIIFNDQLNCYTQNTYTDIDILVRQFTTYHARVPSPFGGGYSYATRPMYVVYYDLSDPQFCTLPFYNTKAKAALYQNGCVMLYTTPIVTDKLLFINNETVENFNYPQGFNLGEMFS